MCDELTEADNQALLTRRSVCVGAVVLLAACAAHSSPKTGAAGSAPTGQGQRTTRSRRVVVDTPDGQADGFFVAPDGSQHPGIVLWPDVAGLREAYEILATRLASAGYAVLAVNPYYRSAPSPILHHFSEWRTDAGQATIAPMREALTPDAVARDGAAFVAWLDAQAEVDSAKKVGTQGYCMSGSFALRTAAAAPQRVGAAASFHGGGLVTEGPDSPHTLFAQMTAAPLVCIAQNDHERDPEAKPALEQAAAAAGLAAEIEVYPANHGWCALDSPVYDAVQAERAWARLLATYEAHL